MKELITIKYFLILILTINAINATKISSRNSKDFCDIIEIVGEKEDLLKVFRFFAEMKRALNNLKEDYEVCQKDLNEIKRTLKSNNRSNEDNFTEIKATLNELKIFIIENKSEKPISNEKIEANENNKFPNLEDSNDKEDSKVNLKETIKEAQKELPVAKPKDCYEAVDKTNQSGIYEIQIDDFPTPFKVFCDVETDDGGWLVIQRRQNGSVDFYRDWLDYELGFGDIEGEFFIGLTKLHKLTNSSSPQELMIVMEDQTGSRVFAKYDAFAIGNATESYALNKLGNYSGTAGDSLSIHKGNKFTTKDRDNDKLPNENCAVLNTGAWWYRACHNSNLNGKYGDNSFGQGINWIAFRGFDYSLPYVKMMIRPSRITL